MSQITKGNILVVTSTFPVDEVDAQPDFIKQLSVRLAGRGFSVTVLAPHYPGAKRYECIDSVDVIRYRYFISAFQKLTYGSGMLENIKKNSWLVITIIPFIVFQLIAISSVIRKRDVRLVHAHWLIPQGIIAAVACKLMPRSRRPKLIITSHGADMFALNSFLLSRLKCFALANADAVTVVSQAMFDYCKEKYEQVTGCVSVKPMGVDLVSRFYPEVSTDLGRKGRIIFVGRLVEKKGVDCLLIAFSEVLKDFPELKLSIVGDGVQREYLESLSMRLNLKKSVCFHGSMLNSEIPEMLRKSAIAVVPSVVAESGDQEGLGLTAVEALGCGCAVVASDLPGIRDVVKHNETGLLFESKNSTELAKSIVFLIKNPEKLNQLAESGRKFVVNRFDWESVTSGYADLISKCLDTRK